MKEERIHRQKRSSENENYRVALRIYIMQKGNSFFT
jgi:hypothetical protein